MELKEDTRPDTTAPTNLPAYAPTQEEKRSLASHRKRLKRRLPCPSLKVIDTKSEDGTLIKRFYDWDHPSAKTAFDLLGASLNSIGDVNFLRVLLLQLAGATSTKNSPSPEVEAEVINFCLPVLQGIKPQDELEVMLASQMAVTHCAFMRMAAKHATAPSLLPEQIYEKQLNRFARTFAAQMQTLKVYRAKGKQSIVVKHVTVSHGGQAIIGKVKHGGRGRAAKEEIEATT